MVVEDMWLTKSKFIFVFGEASFFFVLPQCSINQKVCIAMIVLRQGRKKLNSDGDDKESGSSFCWWSPQRTHSIKNQNRQSRHCHMHNNFEDDHNDEMCV